MRLPWKPRSPLREFLVERQSLAYLDALTGEYAARRLFMEHRGGAGPERERLENLAIEIDNLLRDIQVAWARK